MESDPPTTGGAASPTTRDETTTAPAPSDGADAGRMLMRIARILVLFVYAIAMIAFVVLTITFFLELFGANTSAPFVEWMYRSADRFMRPFRGIFPPIESDGRSVLDVSVLFAMLMYGLFAVAIHALVEWLDRKLYMSTQQPGWSGDPR
jgi:uncharacterized protein YggT (Ycf19 family)